MMDPDDRDTKIATYYLEVKYSFNLINTIIRAMIILLTLPFKNTKKINNMKRENQVQILKNVKRL